MTNLNSDSKTQYMETIHTMTPKSVDLSDSRPSVGREEERLSSVVLFAY